MKRVRLSSKIRKACQGSSSGFTLIEVLITLALIGIIAIAFLSAISTASMALITADERATAESLARSQMEYVKNQEYIDYSEPDHDDYDEITNTEGFEIELLVEPVQTGLQKITVTVSRDDEEVITLENYKRAP